MRKTVSIILALIFLTGGVLAQGVAPSGVGDRVQVGVERSADNWFEVQVNNIKDTFDFFDPGKELENQGIQRLS